MTLMNLLKRSEKLAIDNSPAILTGLGITGVVVTAYLTGQASFKAGHILSEERPMDNREAAKTVWKLYIPAIGSGALTILAIVGANRVGTRRAAAVAAAYSISEKAFSEYKEKVVEKIGATKERAIRDEVAQDQVNRNPVSGKEVIIIGSGEVLCYDSFSGRYFKSDVETIKKAQNDVNHTVLNDSYASLSDFYDRVGLPHTGNSEEVGWNLDKMLEVEFSTCLSDDGRPCISIGFLTSPVRDYYKFR